MTLIQMKYYMTVCQYMSLTKASRELHVSQPALSMAIKKLEDKCGVSLFHHAANSLAITDHGIVLLEEITTIVNQYRNLEQLLSGNLLNRKYLRIGLSVPEGNIVFPEMTSRLQQKHPDIQLFFMEADTHQHYENLDQNKVDLIVTGKNLALSQKEWEDSSIYGHIALRQSDMVLAVSIDHPISKQRDVNWGEIVQQPLILLNDSCRIRAIRNEIQAAGYELPSDIYYTSQLYTVVQFIKQNVAAGFLPAQIVRDHPGIVGVNCPIPKDRWVYLVYRKDRPLPLTTKLFIKSVKEMLSKKTGDRGATQRAGNEENEENGERPLKGCAL